MIKLAGAYAFQTNSSTRRFEYPWVYEQVAALGSGLTIVDVGASLGGMQFTLSRAGHQVHAVDPGMDAAGRGWSVDSRTHRRIADVLGAPVDLHPTTLASAGLGDNSADVVLSVSTLEHLTEADRDEFISETRRILRPGGALILTVDLFLNLAPFTSRAVNEYGVNVDVADLLERCGAELVVGDRREILGTAEFDPDHVLASLETRLISDGYPALAQCAVGRVR